MKKFKKLIPAFCMLLVSAVMLGTTTFAWFSMNNKVTATGLDVTAKANTQFLVIANSLTGGKVEGTAENVAAAKMDGQAEDNKVLPVSLYDANVTWKTAEGDHTYSDKTTAAAGDWFTASSPKYNAATGENNLLTNAKKVNDDLAKYVVKYTCYIAVAADSDAVTTTISAKTTGTAASAIKVAMTVTQNGETEGTPVVVGSTDVEFKKGEKGFELTGSKEATQKYVTVVIYVYVDGFDNAINSKDFVSLTGTLGIEFTANGIN